MTVGAIAYSNSRFGNGMGVIFLDNVACRGIETSLLSCSHSGIGVHNCDHTDDAGVACNSYSKIFLSLPLAFFNLNINVGEDLHKGGSAKI